MPATTSTGECVFCAIGSGQAPAAFVHEDDEFVAVADLRPVTTGHLLVCPAPITRTWLRFRPRRAHGCSRSRGNWRRRCGAPT
ncbi:HIT family protein [Amycolatopsis sp. lyj-109]|uniref:HIT family protein n=1 Tax=Amycolatopsis sp. lyj-109 TaxID=2789287 RepID=UPI00397B3165